MTAQPLDAPRGFVTAAEHYKALAKIDALEAELQEAREALEEATGAHVSIRMRLALPSLTFREAAIVSALYQASSVVTYQALYNAAPHGRRRVEDPLDPYGTVKTVTCWTRKKLRCLGAPDTIQTYSGHGYALTRFGREWLRERLSLTTGDPGAIAGQFKARGKT